MQWFPGRLEVILMCCRHEKVRATVIMSAVEWSAHDGTFFTFLTICEHSDKNEIRSTNNALHN